MIWDIFMAVIFVVCMFRYPRATSGFMALTFSVTTFSYIMSPGYSLGYYKPLMALFWIGAFWFDCRRHEQMKARQS